jgi:hypothetical protein
MKYNLCFKILFTVKNFVKKKSKYTRKGFLFLFHNGNCQNLFILPWILQLLYQIYVQDVPLKPPSSRNIDNVNPKRHECFQ